MTLRVINFADGFTSENVPVADAIQAHIDNPTDAHDASAISYDNTDSELVADDVQAAIDEVELRLDTAETNISNHINNATDAHDASAISYVNTTSGLTATDLQAAVDEVEGRLDTAETDIQAIEDSIGQANGIAPLNGSSKIDAIYLPSYVDDVLEYADFASLPVSGETGKIYVTLDTNKTYRWTGSIYVEISPSEVTSVNSQTGAVVLDADDIAETATRYWSKKNNVANTMPLVGNDASENYSVGSQWYDAINDTLYICEDATIGAAVWQPISGAGGGVGSVDIMFADTFENTDIADYTITQPLASISDVSPLQGENSLLIAHDFNPSYYIERIIPVDNKFKNKNVTFTLDVFSNAVSGNLTLSVWDHTNTVQLLNSELIQPQDVDQTSVKRSFSFNIPSGANELRYRLNVLFDSGKVSRVDNLVIELTQMSKLDTTIETPIITEWQDYSLVIGATVTAPTQGVSSVNKAQWRRVGANMEIRYDYKQTGAGTTGSGNYLFPMPAGYSADTAKIPSGSAEQNIVGIAKMANGTSAVGGATVSGVVLLSKTYPNNFLLNYAQTSTENTTYVSSAAYPLNSATVGFSFTASVPILGWEATETQSVSLAQTVLVQESDSALDVYGGAFGSTNTRVVRFASISKNIGDAITYVPSLTLGDSFIVNRAGNYDLSFTAKISAAVQIGITKNLVATGAVITGDNLLTNTETGGANFEGNCSTSAYLEVGDVIRCHVGAGTFQSSADKRACNFQISYQGSLKQLNVSENQKIEIPTSELRMEGASSRGTGSETFTVKFANIAKLRGDAFEVDNSNATIITMKKKGKLSITANLRTNASACSISLNQLVNTTFPLSNERIATSVQSGSAIGVHNISCTIDVSIGDKIRINAETTPTSDVANNLNLSFQEQEVAVSVTNVLPQFSESDSSVRVDTANGYGSPTGTKIRRFSNVRDNLGSAIAYNDGSLGSPATVGDYFIINESGDYDISYTDSLSVDQSYLGLSKNASSLTTNIDAIASVERLALSRTSGTIGTCAWSGYLQAGDVIRAHTEATASSNVNHATFTISKVGKPNVTGVDVTPFAKIEYEVKQSFIATSGAQASTNNRILYFTSVLDNSNNGLGQIENSATLGFSFTALKPCTIDMSYTLGSVQAGGISRNATGADLTTALFSLSQDKIVVYSSVISGGNTTVSAQIKLNKGDVIRPHTQQGSSTTIGTFQLVATELRDAYQVIGGGIENTHTATVQGGTSIILARNTDFLTVSRTSTGTYNATYKFPLSSIPSVIVTCINDANEVGTSGLSNYGYAHNFTSTGFSYKIGYENGEGGDGGFLQDRDHTIQLVFQGSDYRTPSKAIGLPAQRVAVIKDVKVAGSAMQPLTASVWTVRVLNNLVDPTGLVTSLASNQFTLPSGKYFISARCPVMSGVSTISFHKAALYNVTDAANILIGTTERTLSPSGSSHTGNSVIEGHFTLTASKTLDIRHIVTTTYSAEAPPNFSSTDEIYTTVVITKIEE